MFDVDLRDHALWLELTGKDDLAQLFASMMLLSIKSEHAAKRLRNLVLLCRML